MDGNHLPVCEREGVAITTMPTQKRYTVRYRDSDSTTKESCYYAHDAFEARVLAMEMVRYIHDHPHAIDLIRCESYPLRYRAA